LSSCRSLGFGFTRGEKLFGVDFLGGDSTTFSFAQKVDVEHSRRPDGRSAKRTRKSNIKKTSVAAWKPCA
jgi:hypothetical protein